MMNNKKIKIFWIKLMHHPIYMDILDTLLERYHDIELTVTAYEGKKINNRRINVEYMPKSPRILPFTGMERTPGIEGMMEKIKPDIVISNLYYSQYSYRAYRFAKKNNIKFILNAEEKDRKRLIRKVVFPLWDITVGKRILDYASAILAWSRGSKKFMCNIVKNKDKVKLFFAGVNTKIFYPDKQKKYSYGKLKLLMAARMVPCKEHERLLQALEYLKRKKFFDFRINFLGNGPLKEEIQQKIEEYKLEKEAQIINRILHGEMRNIYTGHDVLILPSKGEAIGMVVPEAMACGTPVIVSDSVGAKDYVIEPENGLIFKTGDYKDLVDKIMQISKMDLEKMGKSAAEHISENYNIEKAADEFYSILKNL